jgi:ribosomal protein S10
MIWSRVTDLNAAELAGNIKMPTSKQKSDILNNFLTIMTLSFVRYGSGFYKRLITLFYLSAIMAKTLIKRQIS